MALNAPAVTVVNPSFTEPGLILPYSQSSGYRDLLAGGKAQAKLSEGDLFVFLNRVDVRTQATSGQAAVNQLPGIDVTFSQISTPTYLLQVAADYNHHDIAAAGRRNASLPQLQQLGMRQAIFQLLRTATLYGFNPVLGEGVVNTNGATAVILPPDSNANSTVVTYDNGQMALFLLSQVAALKTRTNQLGQGRTFTFLGPQRVLSLFEYAGVVQLTQYQRPGAGTETVTGMVKEILLGNGDKVLWAYDDTLIGKGQGGTDAVLLVMPEVEKPLHGGDTDTNVFSEVAPGFDACVTLYTDMPMPREIYSPLPRGCTDVLMEMRSTSGFGVRPEAVTIISMQYQ